MCKTYCNSPKNATLDHSLQPVAAASVRHLSLLRLAHDSVQLLPEPTLQNGQCKISGKKTPKGNCFVVPPPPLLRSASVAVAAAVIARRSTAASEELRSAKSRAFRAATSSDQRSDS